MDQHELLVDIKPAEESQLDVLEEVFSPDNRTNPQYRRYAVQKKNEGVYLIAWLHDEPIGHFLLRWSGPQDEHVNQHVDVTRSAFLEAGLTVDPYRKKGVATSIIHEAERLAKERGCAHIGLEVGSTDNPEARRLYEKLGFVDWGHGEFEISWEFIDRNGNRRIDSEIVIYMQKSI